MTHSRLFSINKRCLYKTNTFWLELDETFSVGLSNVVDGGRSVTASALSGTGTINNDDSAQFTVSSESGNEDDGPLTFTVTLSNAVDVATSVDVSTSDGSALLSDSDYTPVSTLTLNFAAGVTSQTFDVLPTADNTVELDETFSVGLSNVVDGGRSVMARMRFPLDVDERIGAGYRPPRRFVELAIDVNWR